MSKVMLVTGAARGIGAATARMAAARGYDVCITYAGRDEAAAAVVADIEAAGRKGYALKADAGTEEGVLATFETIDRKFGRLDVFVGNAGVTGAFTRVADLDSEMLRRTLDINIFGLLLSCREAVRRMSTSRGGPGGSIVLISSVAAELGSPDEYVHYAATKGAVNSMTVGLAREVALEGIRVNAVAPGMIETDIHADAGRPERLSEKAPAIPMHRPGTAEEIAESVIWLASEAASYCTGSILKVSGGR
jgi:NAD(P)-dependent dehydrogenase (short-subunit alcohol dehydrogenase family)